MGPTQVAEIQNLPNVVIKAGRAVKFFLCDNGHIESWLGETDTAGMPWRPCSKCSSRMELTTRRIKKDGTLVVPVRQKRGAKKVASKAPSEELMLKRFARCLRHPYVEYKIEYVNSGMIRVTRKGDRPVQKGGRLYRRFVEVTVDTSSMRAQIDLYGVRGWFEDFRVAGKKCKLNPVAKFLPPLSSLIVRSDRSAKGDR